MTEPALRRVTEEEYLVLLETSAEKYEYIDGVLYAQAGSSLPHLRISRNINRLLANATQGGPCWAYGSDMKVRISRLGRTFYYFPDAVVICIPHQDSLRTAEENPCLVVEILSPGTRQVDLTYKMQDYLSLPSLQGYLIVDSEARAAELHRRTPNGWALELVQERVNLPCLELTLTLAEIYDGTSL